ncbi:MAG TPA: hypothetical protein VHB01_08410 [Nitrosospira sp.]|jgi:hypothetical protein|nr:hypothetical protein [Nitrosospira sp.]
MANKAFFASFTLSDITRYFNGAGVAPGPFYLPPDACRVMAGEERQVQQLVYAPGYLFFLTLL